VKYTTERGTCVRLDGSDHLGDGGEGRVFGVAGHHEYVGKVYHCRDGSAERRAKLHSMIQNPPVRLNGGGPPNGRTTIAWPLRMLIDPADPGGAAGFIMRAVRDTVPIYDVYSVLNRVGTAETRGIDYRRMCVTAYNLATVVEQVHAAGHVVGDLSFRNVRVHVPTATVSLIDCDSMQVRERTTGRIYNGSVMTPEFAAPESQTWSAGTPRTQHHDAFALAVLLYMLLTDGSHPFRAVPLNGPPITDITRLIAAGAWPYGNKAFGVPNGALSFNVVPAELRGLFDRCFADGHQHPDRRPTAREWRKALARWTDRAAFRTCIHNPAHHYPPQGGFCPWCLWGDRTGCDPFPGAAGGVEPGAPVRRNSTTPKGSSHQAKRSSGPTPLPPAQVVPPVTGVQSVRLQSAAPAPLPAIQGAGVSGTHGSATVPVPRARLETVRRFAAVAWHIIVGAVAGAAAGYVIGHLVRATVWAYTTLAGMNHSLYAESVRTAGMMCSAAGLVLGVVEAWSHARRSC
jgi:DNA-binding helix-hairpin-helix protein with protein kinase domain